VLQRVERILPGPTAAVAVAEGEPKPGGVADWTIARRSARSRGE
jgi:hypothetical protein